MYLSYKQLAFGIVAIVLAAYGSFALMRASDEREGSIATSTTDAASSASPETIIDATSPEGAEKGTSSGAPSPAKPSGPASSLSGKAAPEFVRPTGFTNSDPFLLSSLRGERIAVVEFWSASSLDSAKVVPYLNGWQAKYRNYGLTIIGVHTPRYVFERSKIAVDEYAKANDMTFPIVVDNGAETWTAYKNKTWPHLYLIDLDGRIVYDHSGSGDLAIFEKKMVDLLNARAAKKKLPAPPDQKPVVIQGDGTLPGARKSAEAYFGANKNSNLANGIPNKEGVQTFDALSESKLDMIYLFGGWKIAREYAESMSEYTHAIYKYRAKRVYSIMGAERIFRVRVLLDGSPIPEASAGKDIRYEKGESVAYVSHERLYDLVKHAAYDEHTIEIIPDSGGLDIYTLTFD